MWPWALGNWGKERYWQCNGTLNSRKGDVESNPLFILSEARPHLDFCSCLGCRVVLAVSSLHTPSWRTTEKGVSMFFWTTLPLQSLTWPFISYLVAQSSPPFEASCESDKVLELLLNHRSLLEHVRGDLFERSRGWASTRMDCSPLIHPHHPPAPPPTSDPVTSLIKTFMVPHWLQVKV